MTRGRLMWVAMNGANLERVSKEVENSSHFFNKAIIYSIGSFFQYGRLRWHFHTLKACLFMVAFASKIFWSTIFFHYFHSITKLAPWPWPPLYNFFSRDGLFSGISFYQGCNNNNYSETWSQSHISLQFPLGFVITR